MRVEVLGGVERRRRWRRARLAGVVSAGPKLVPVQFTPAAAESVESGAGGSASKGASEDAALIVQQTLRIAKLERQV